MTKGNLIGSIYVLNSASDLVVLATSADESTKLWHHRLGHFSESGMLNLHSR